MALEPIEPQIEEMIEPFVEETSEPEPTATGENGEQLTGHEAEVYALNQSNQGERAQISRDLNRARGGISLEENTGRQDRGNALGTKKKIVKQREDKHRRMMSSALKDMQAQLDQHLAELNRQISKIEAQIEVLQEEIDVTEAALEEKFGSDWKEKGKNGELAGNPLWDQYILQQQKMDDFLRDKEDLIRQRDKATELAQRAERGDSSVLKEMQELNITQEGKHINNKAIRNIASARQVAKVEKALGRSEEFIEDTEDISGNVDNDILDLEFEDELPFETELSRKATVANYVAPSPIQAPPIDLHFAKASNSMRPIDDNKPDLQMVEKVDIWSPGS